MSTAAWCSRPFPVIGMLHAPPLPGSCDYQGDFESIRAAVLRDARALADGGVDGMMLENFGDAPFYPGRVPAMTVAAITALACEVRSHFQIPLGINVLRNDGCSAIAIAVACGASFIRVNILCGARVADQGLLQGIAHDLLRERSSLRAEKIQIWADIDVKHSAPLAARPLEDELHDLIGRGKADAVIVSGAATGRPIDLQTLQAVKAAAGSTPVLIGSGVSIRNIAQFVPFANGAIIGSSLKEGGRVERPVDVERVREFVTAVR